MQACLYTKDGIAQRLGPLMENDPAKYLELSVVLSEGLTTPRNTPFDPQEIYAATVPCFCSIGHNNVFLTDQTRNVDLSKVNIRAGMEKLGLLEAS